MGSKTAASNGIPAGFEEKKELLRRYLARHGLRNTHQREVILKEFLQRHQHVTIEELWEQVRQVDPSIGYATVYRTLRLFTECGIASRHEFSGGGARFEGKVGHHHDHMICTACGKIIEFENEEIEKLQEVVCRQARFQMKSHKMELYGFCSDCKE